jgi:uncharacterized protein YciI
MRPALAILVGLLFAGLTPTSALANPPASSYDAELAARVGADEHGMRQYVLVILKTGPRPVPAGEERKKMFQGHFANMERLANEGKLVLAGPFDGADGWRGMFIFAVKDIAEARQLTASDPVIVSGEMVAEYHPYFGSASLMLINEWHKKITKPEQ